MTGRLFTIKPQLFVVATRDVKQLSKNRLSNLFLVFVFVAYYSILEIKLFPRCYFSCLFSNTVHSMWK